MNNEEPQTDAKAPAGTGGEQPAATQKPNGQAPATVDPSKIELPEGYELIKTEDKKNLVSQRDKANNDTSENSVVLNALLQKDAVRDAIAKPEFKEKFPNVTEDDLLEANPTSDEEILQIAEAKQQRYAKVINDHLANVQVADTPTISPQDKDAKLKDLASPSTKSRFAQALQVMRTPTK